MRAKTGGRVSSRPLLRGAYEIVKRTFLVLGKLAASIIDETLRVNEVDALACLILGETLQLEEAHELHSDADTGGASTQEKDAMIVERAARCSRRELCSVHKTGEDDSTSPLDVIIEERVAIAEDVKEVESLLKFDALVFVA